jgi:hypothetical protein
VLHDQDTSNSEDFEPRHSVREFEDGPIGRLSDIAVLAVQESKKARQDVEALASPQKDKKDEKDKKETRKLNRQV